MRADHRSDDIERIAHVGHPIPDRFARRILERARPGMDRHHARTEHFHPAHIQLLALDVLVAHVHVAGKSHARRHGCRRHTVLPGTRLGDDAFLAGALGQQDLTDGVVDLVCTGMAEIFALEIDLRLAIVRRETVGACDRRRPAGKGRQEFAQFRLECRILARILIQRLEFIQRRDEGLGHVAAAVSSEIAPCIGHRSGSELQQERVSCGASFVQCSSDHRRKPADIIHQGSEARRLQRLRAIRECGGRIGVDLDHQPVRPGGDRGHAHRRHGFPHANAVTRIHDHGKMRESS